MNQDQQDAILAIALLAAFADGANDPREREHIRETAEAFGGVSGTADLQRLYHKVLLKQVSVAEAAAVLTEPAHRQLAYETAVCVCDADGRLTDAEQTFLTELAGVLKLESTVTTPINAQAETMADLVEEAAPAQLPAPDTTSAAPVATDPAAEAEIDRSILNYAILNGALELLPQSWASMAIIPLQIKMVYSIGQSNGYELDQGHIRELLTTVGVGLTSQYLEQFGRKLLGGLLGKVGGGLGRGLGKAATGVAFSFATTYALGHVAKRYYAGGRQMSTALLQETFQTLLVQAKGIQTQYLPQIQEKAGSLDAAQIMSMVRGR